SLIPLIRASSAALFLPFIDNPEGVELTAGGKAASYKGLLDESQDSHGAILDAVLEGKAAKAETAARKHIGRTLGMVDRFDEWRKVIAEAATHEHSPASPGPPSAADGGNRPASPPKRRPRKASSSS